MKVLVLGGTRFIGRKLIFELLHSGHDVTLISRGKTRPHYPGTVKTIWGDRENPAVIQNATSGSIYDIVFDNIAYGETGVTSFLEQARNKFRHYVMTSSAWVYAVNGPQENEVCNESSLNPNQFKLKESTLRNFEKLGLPDVTRKYVTEKLAAEKAAFSVLDNVTILRPSMVSGTGDHNQRISYFLSDNAAPFMKGEQKIQLLWVNDLVQVMLSVISAFPEGKTIFNVAPVERISRQDVCGWVQSVKKGEFENFIETDEPFSVNVPGYFDTRRLLKTFPSFHYTKGESWVKKVAQEIIQMKPNKPQFVLETKTP